VQVTHSSSQPACSGHCWQWLAKPCRCSALRARSHNSWSDTFDTAYVKDYSHILTGRLYSSTKYNKMQLGGLKGTKALIFRPNSKYNFGVGASYHALTLNIGVGIPGLNKDQDIRGETRYFDAQANVYTKRWASNVFLQRFQGYYFLRLSFNQENIGYLLEDRSSFYWSVGNIRLNFVKRFDTLMKEPVEKALPEVG
jgi:hypothetical protein